MRRRETYKTHGQTTTRWAFLAMAFPRPHLCSKPMSCRDEQGKSQSRLVDPWVCALQRAAKYGNIENGKIAIPWSNREWEDSTRWAFVAMAFPSPHVYSNPRVVRLRRENLCPGWLIPRSCLIQIEGRTINTYICPLQSWHGYVKRTVSKRYFV